MPNRLSKSRFWRQQIVCGNSKLTSLNMISAFIFINHCNQFPILVDFMLATCNLGGRFSSLNKKAFISTFSYLFSTDQTSWLSPFLHWYWEISWIWQQLPTEKTISQHALVFFLHPHASGLMQRLLGDSTTLGPQVSALEVEPALFADSQPPAESTRDTPVNSVHTHRMDTHRRALSRNFLPKLGAALCDWSLTCKTNCDLRPKFHIQPNSPASVHTAAPAGLSRPRPWLCCLRRLDRLLFCLEVRGNPAADSGSVRGFYIIRSGSASPLEFAKETPSKVDVPITISSFIL